MVAVTLVRAARASSCVITWPDVPVSAPPSRPSTATAAPVAATAAAAQARTSRFTLVTFPLVRLSAG
ncbi:hypothetical protein ACFSTC_43380 [Nonomuraea ferruginea]